MQEGLSAVANELKNQKQSLANIGMLTEANEKEELLLDIATVQKLQGETIVQLLKEIDKLKNSVIGFN
jgi:hypothetical protein